MKRGLLAAGVIVGAVLLAGCDDTTDTEDQQRSCFDQGGVYFESEATSAGYHIWCITKDGVDIGPSVSEGDR